MITLRDFRDQTRHLPPDSQLGISYDEELGRDVIAIRTPDSDGLEEIVDCEDLPLDNEE